MNSCLQSLERVFRAQDQGGHFLPSENSLWRILGLGNHSSQTLSFLDQKNLLKTSALPTSPHLGQYEV